MPAVELLFDRTAASGPPWVLLFGDLLGHAPSRTLEFAAQFDELRFAGRASSIIPTPGTPEAFPAYLTAESAKWGELIRARGITLE